MKCNPDQTDFLDRIYKTDPSGNKDMFQASLALEMEYGVSPQDAEILIIDWMKDYEKRYKRTSRTSNSGFPSQRRIDSEIREFSFAK